MATARDKVQRNDPLTKAIAKVVRDAVAKPNVRAIAEALLAASLCDGYAPKRVVDVCRASVRSVQRTRRHEAATLRELMRPRGLAGRMLARDYFERLVIDELSRQDAIPKPDRDRGAQKACERLTDHACHIFGLPRLPTPTLKGIKPARNTDEGLRVHRYSIALKQLGFGGKADVSTLLRALLVVSGMRAKPATKLVAL
jgi:hypothetical protein